MVEAAATPGHGPFGYINFDCMNMIISYLSPADVVQCTLVNKRWRQHIHAWISLFGLRRHWSHMAEARNSKAGPDNDMSAIRQYKELVRLDIALTSGTPTSTTRYSDVVKFAVAGDYMVWSVTNDGIYWRYLPYGESGSVREQRKLHLSSVTGPMYKIWIMHLNSDGYLFFRFEKLYDEGRFSPNTFFTSYPRGTFSDALFSLQNGNAVWHEEYRGGQPATIARRRQRPFLLGRKRLYFYNDKECRLSAYDFKTNQQLYSVEVPTHFFDSINSSGPALAFYELVRAHDKEIIARIQKYPRFAHIMLCDLANGQLLQKISLPDYTLSLFLSTPDSGGFSLVLSPPWPSKGANIRAEVDMDDFRFRVIQIYSYQPADELFKLVATNAVILDKQIYDPIFSPFTQHAITYRGVSEDRHDFMPDKEFVMVSLAPCLDDVLCHKARVVLENKNYDHMRKLDRVYKSNALHRLKAPLFPWSSHGNDPIFLDRQRIAYKFEYGDDCPRPQFVHVFDFSKRFSREGISEEALYLTMNPWV
ncbi:hypothetical protein AJ79_03059 [Helicocarpus griseus UAMH5409]|uniref:F-box domain-containing protein n=1 Tax=Helicocarpus griseus UAMH5409 TaxID=1447875 RepID=A0A2B7XYY2_9EURO|nr:hypothetical protein AJ79_03059 [Helicocarpus griseus UAMH5409]